jgi:beta-galactosidase
MIKLEVKGGRLLAFGNACPFNKKSYSTDESETYYGQALAIVQADGSGPVEIRAISGYLTALATIPAA